MPNKMPDPRLVLNACWSCLLSCPWFKDYGLVLTVRTAVPVNFVLFHDFTDLRKMWIEIKIEAVDAPPKSPGI